MNTNTTKLYKNSYQIDNRAFEFKKVETTAQGVEVFEVSASDGFITSGLAWGHPVIRYNGKAYLAASIYNNITGDSYAQAAIRFGRGRGRSYVAITEDLINEFSTPYIRTYPSQDALQRAARIQAFAVALIDFI